VRIDDLGDELETLATTTTAGGRYGFNLTSLRLGFASDLVVTAGTGASRMRAVVARAALDVEPISEAMLQLVLLQGASLADFTVEEADDLDLAAHLFATTHDLQALGDVATTVDLVRTELFADPALASFLSSAAQPGQTTDGPGDVGDYFPSSVGDTWQLRGEDTLDASPPQELVHTRRITAIDGANVQTVEEEDSSEGGDSTHEFLEERGDALVNHGNDDPSDPTGAVVPFDEVRFPLRTGETWVQFDVHALPVDDLDFDGDPESLDAHSVRTVFGFESVDVFGEALENCVRLDTTLRLTLRLSSGPRSVATLTAHEWFAPGVGPVAVETTIVGSLDGTNSTETRTESLAAYQAGSTGRGILPGHELLLALSAANSDQETPGRPGVGFNGTNYLLVSCRDGSGLIGSLVTPTGIVLGEFPLLGTGSGCSSRAVVASDGTDFLVVFQTSGSVDLVGMRISAAGDVLDPTGFPIATSGVSNSSPSLVFDGTHYFVVWRSFDNVLQGEIHGAFVEPDGTVQDEFVVHTAAGNQAAPALVLGGGQFLVAWVDGVFDTNVRGARVSLAGGVLDPLGFDVAVSADSESEPVLSFDGARYLAVWTQDPTPNFIGGNIGAARLELDGTMSDLTPLEIATGDSSVTPTVVFDGTNHFVAWEVESFFPPGGIHAARVSPLGELLDGPADSLGIEIERIPGSALLSRPALARGTANLFLTWVVNKESGGETKDVAGTQIYPSGP
jgi:hypothetical protein